MSDIITTLAAHAAKYPLMEPTDAVKLIFQSEYGGGHIIKDERLCRRFLCDEYAAVGHDAAAPRFERIGGGFVRVNLAPMDENELARLADAFIESAKNHSGNDECFNVSLREMSARFGEIGFSFTEAELADYISAYLAGGIRPVSHSERYRKAYRPAYRVVKEEYWLK